MRGEIVDVVEKPDHATRQRAVKDGWALRGRIGSTEGESGRNDQPVQINVHYATLRLVERLVGRKFIRDDSEESESPESGQAESPAEESDPFGDR